MATVKINEKLVSIIKDKRKKKKLTQKDMAEYLQISFSNYQRRKRIYPGFSHST